MAAAGGAALESRLKRVEKQLAAATVVKSKAAHEKFCRVRTSPFNLLPTLHCQAC